MTRIMHAVLPMLLVALALAGCTRGPDPAVLQRDVQSQLDTLFGSRMIEVKSLRRQGSAPTAGAKDGGPQAIVYYNAVLAFTASYDPSDWNGLSPQLVASALGATDQGVVGLAAGPMAAGSEIRAYGSMVYRRVQDTWQASLLPPAAASVPATTTTDQARSAELIERLAGIVSTTPGLPKADDVIVAEELERALQNIRLRLNRGEHGFVVATGPPGGEYVRFVDSLRPRGASWSVIPVNTEGSVTNAVMIDAGEARFGLVQSDVAAAAVTGQAGFADDGPLRHLRAVASLFPEPVHVVVRKADGLATVADLRGKRVALGTRGSGTRQTAEQVLRAYGLGPGDYLIVAARDPDEALQLLTANRIDALIEVAAAPWRQLVAAAAATPLALLPLDAGFAANVTDAVPGLVPLVIPPRTYAQQEESVPTVAATALLIARDSVPDAVVERVLDFLFATDLAAERGVGASRLSRERAQAGVTIPLHDGAAAYFVGRPNAAAQSTAAP